MVLKGAISLISSFFGPREHPAIIVKESPCSHEAIGSDVGTKLKEEGLAESQALSSLSKDEVCCVCLSRLVEGEDMRVLPCLHEFHKVCVDKWFDACQTTCPLCRFPVGGGEKSQVVELLTEEIMFYFSSFHISGF
ncbi:hypothetical protein C1H46_033456 [Malus baccata]|uniref:RING-type E3 ubiquitin transferase n=1 Tax=Malus baccata TaxID=106549 RepID=A0A540L3B0_MALBA|nr:hypothetical protein C1H46_033456 [Malus baccata]